MILTANDELSIMSCTEVNENKKRPDALGRGTNAVAKWNSSKFRKGLMIPELETLRKTAQHSTTEQGKPIFVNHCLIGMYTARGPPLPKKNKKIKIGHSKVCHKVFAWRARCLSESEMYLLQLLSNLFLELKRLLLVTQQSGYRTRRSPGQHLPALWGAPVLGCPTWVHPQSSRVSGVRFTTVLLAQRCLRRGHWITDSPFKRCSECRKRAPPGDTDSTYAGN